MHSLGEHAMLQGNNLQISSFCSLVVMSDLWWHTLTNPHKKINDTNLRAIHPYLLVNICSNIQHTSFLSKLPYMTISCMDFIMAEIGIVTTFVMSFWVTYSFAAEQMIYLHFHMVNWRFLYFARFIAWVGFFFSKESGQKGKRLVKLWSLCSNWFNLHYGQAANERWRQSQKACFCVWS